MTQLDQRLEKLRRAARRALMVRGLCWVVVFAFSTMLVAGWADWCWHIQGNLRLAIGIVTLGGVGWLSWRLLVRPMMRALSNVELAIKIERRYPGFRDSLASTVQFQTEHADPRLGSPELQRQVIAETLPHLDAVDLDAVIEQRGVRWAATMAFAVSLLVLVIVGFNQTEAATAVRRLLFPYSAKEWDRDTTLQLLDEKLEAIRLEPGQPFRRVQGDTFRVYVENLKGELPEDTRLEIKDADGEIRREKLRRLVVRDSHGVVHRLGTANLLLDRGPMHFRAVGGDDRDMGWHRLEVVPAPRVESLRVTLIPPAYSGRKQETLPPNIGHIRALVGTEVRIEAKSHTTLQFARLRVKSDPPREAKLSADGRGFRITFRLTERGNYSYWFDLKDRQGFDNPNSPRYDIRAIRDRVPTVRVIRPPRNTRVTKKAVVPIQVIAEDDIALHEVRIRYRSSVDPDGPYQTVVLQQPTKPYRWRIGALPNVVKGMEYRFFVEAVDNFNLDEHGVPRPGKALRHVGKSLTRTITIVSDFEKAAEIARDYGALLDELSRIAKDQRQAHDDVSQLLLQLKQTGKLRPDVDLPLLRRVERAQREINVRIAEPGGVSERAERLIEELQNNHVDEPVLRRRLLQISGVLAELQKHLLPKIEARLTVARKSADDEMFAPPPGEKSRAADPATQQERLREARDGQQAVLESIDALVAALREWRNWQNLLTDLDELIKTQETLHRNSLILKAGTLGLRPTELNRQQQADLAKYAEGQRRLADRLSRFHKDISGFLEAMEASDNRNALTIRTLSDASDYVRNQNFAARMREVSGQIDANLLGRATGGQEKLIDELGEIKAILENRGASDLETLIKKQQAAERELAGLEDRQEELFKQVDEASKLTDRGKRREQLEKLVKQQVDLRRNLNQMAGRLQRLLANLANDAARRAAGSMERSAESLGSDDLKQNRRDQEETLEHLEQARRELAKTRAQAEEQLAREQLERIADELRGVVKRQQNVIDGTVRLQAAYEQAQRWSRGRLMTLDSMKDEQLALRAKMQGLAKKTSAAAVVSRVLRNLGTAMQSAAFDLVASRKTPSLLPKTIEQQRAVKKRLVDLIATMSGTNVPRKSGSSANAGGEGSRQRQPGLVSLITQWKLLKSLQEDTLRQTEKLQQGRKPGTPPTADLKQAIAGLANEQSKLADISDSVAPKSSQPIPQPAEKQDPQINIQNEPPILPEKAKSNGSPTLAELARRVSSGMRAASDSLAKGDTGKQTQNRQRQVIEDLERLIREAKQQLSRSNVGQPSGKPSTRKSKPKPGKTDSKKTHPDRKQNGASRKDSPGKEKKKPRDSNPGTRDPAKELLRLRTERRNALIREIWGHLPKREKQRLRNVAGDKFVPKYKSQLNRYYESLAEE